MKWHTHADDVSLANALADAVADNLDQAMQARDHAFLALSGGKTPIRFLQTLSQRDIDWQRLIVTLVDERWVPDDNPRSNARLVRDNLLQGKAAASRFEPLYRNCPEPVDALASIEADMASWPWPLDVAVLGMGTNGHTASFFPEGDYLAKALDMDTTATVLPMHAPDAGEPRITLTLPVLARARSCHLQIEGAEKRDVLEQALHGADYPMGPVTQAIPAMDVYWCP